MNQGNYELLQNVSPQDRDLREVDRLGPGASYYLAKIFTSIGNHTLAQKLLTREIYNGDDPWRTEATDLYFSGLFDRELYGQAESVAQEILEKQPGNIQVFAYLIESRYWRRQDQNVLDDLIHIGSMDVSALAAVRITELSLFEAVSKTRLQKEGWKDDTLALYLRNEYGMIQDRLYQFLIRGGYLESIPESTVLLINGFAEYSHGDGERAAENLGEFLTSADIGVLLNAAEGFYRSVGLVLQVSDADLSGAVIFRDLADVSDDTFSAPHARIRLLREYSGKLYRSGRNYRAAAEQFRLGVRSAADPYQADRMRWYLVDSIAGYSRAAAVDEIIGTAGLWSDSELLDDAIERLMPSLVQTRSFQELIRLKAALSGSVALRAVGRINFVLAAAINANLVEDVSLDKDLLLRNTLTQAEPYYEFLAAAALGIDPLSLSAGESDQTALSVDWGLPDVLADGYLRYGLIADAERVAAAHPGDVSPRVILRIANELNRDQAHLRALRLMGSLSRRPGYVMTRADLEAAYPQAYLSDMLKSANAEKLPVHVFYGMVRTESFFSPEIVSRAGAVGLSQLMPETADEISGRLRISDADLTDPGTNLAFGAWYLAHLAGRTGSLSDAVFAYNAGITRVRSWRSRYPGLPDELFLEMIPIDETRTHGMKVLVSASIYGYLYFGIPVQDTVSRYFGNFGF